jgi:hypothetical protein
LTGRTADASDWLGRFRRNLLFLFGYTTSFPLSGTWTCTCTHPFLWVEHEHACTCFVLFLRITCIYALRSTPACAFVWAIQPIWCLYKRNIAKTPSDVFRHC